MGKKHVLQPKSARKAGIYAAISSLNGQKGEQLMRREMIGQSV